MSFANKLKQQLLNLRYDELRQLRARTHGLLRFSKAFGPQKMLLQTENKNVAEQYADSIFGLIGLDATISVNEYKNQNGKSFSAQQWTIRTIGRRSCVFLVMTNRLRR